jgi:hypothetical protein
VAITTPPWALSQSISVKLTKEELKDLLLKPNDPCARVKEGLLLRAPYAGVGQDPVRPENLFVNNAKSLEIGR